MTAVLCDQILPREEEAIVLYVQLLCRNIQKVNMQPVLQEELNTVAETTPAPNIAGSLLETVM